MVQPKDNDIFVPLLEEAEENDLPQVSGFDGMSSADPSVSAKLWIAEKFLKLLTKDLSFSEFIQELLMDALQIIECEAASILEVDYEKNIIFFRAATGFSSDSITKFTIPRGHGIAGQCAEQKKPILIDEISENKVHLKSIEKAVGFKTLNMLAVPIVIRGKSYGVLELLNRKKADSFSEADVELVQFVAELAARAIEIRMIVSFAKSGNGFSEQTEAA